MQQTSQLNPVTFMASANGQRTKKGWSEKLQGALLTVATTALIGNFTFLWKLNALAAKLEDHDAIHSTEINDLNLKINTIQLDTRDVRERVIRIEAKQNKTN